jgi:hypothetical protein
MKEREREKKKAKASVRTTGKRNGNQSNSVLPFHYEKRIASLLTTQWHFCPGKVRNLSFYIRAHRPYPLEVNFILGQLDMTVVSMSA